VCSLNSEASKGGAVNAITLLGRNPFNQNFWAEVRKFLGVEWVATGPKGLVPFHSQNEFPAHLQHCKRKDVGLLWLVLS